MIEASRLRVARQKIVSGGNLALYRIAKIPSDDRRVTTGDKH